MKNSSIYYTPHQVASFFSITKDTLLFYDKIGLFSPARRKKNGYRCYSASQLNELDTILTLRDLGISISEIKEAVTKMNTPSFIDLLEKQEESIERKMDEYRFVLDIVRSTRATIKEAAAAEKERLFIERQPAIPIVKVPIEDIGEESTSDEAWEKAYSCLMASYDCKAIITIGSILSLAEAESHLGTICREVFATYKKSSEHVIPKGLYAHMYFQGSLSNLTSFYKKFFASLEEHELVPTGNVYEELTISSVVAREEKDHVTKLLVRVEKT